MKGFTTPLWLIMGFIALGVAFWALFIGSGILGQETDPKPTQSPYFVETKTE